MASVTIPMHQEVVGCPDLRGLSSPEGVVLPSADERVQAGIS